MKKLQIRKLLVKSDLIKKNNIERSIVSGSKAASTASYVLIGKVFTFLMTGIALVIVTRILGPSQYGIYTLSVAFAGIFGTRRRNKISTNTLAMILYLKASNFSIVKYI